MSITSLSFAAFVVVVVAVYHVLPAVPRRWWLLIASYTFYYTWSWTFPVVLLVVTLVNFAVALRLSARPSGLRLGIAFNLAALGFFKYASFLVPGTIGILLPIGLSFYVLQAISYLLDVSRGQMAAEADFVAFALYMAYFPKLLAGPIERARAFLPKLAATRLVDADGVARSITLIVIGVVRKAAIADPLAKMIPSQAFTAPAESTGFAIWLLAYAFSLYNDFAGYTDIVRGVSGLFGIELSPNFAQPFFARSFTEFWTRWHMSLSFWLRDYVYLPLSRRMLRRNLRRDNVPNLIIPPLTTMLVCGLWHGPGLNMLIWGGLHGVYLIGERIVTLGRPVIPVQHRPRWQQGLRMLVVFALGVVAFIPFRVEPSTAVECFKMLLRGRGWAWPDVRVLALIAPALWIDWMQARHQDEVVFLRWPLLPRAALLAVAMLAVLLATQGQVVEPFVYEGF